MKSLKESLLNSQENTQLFEKNVGAIEPAVEEYINANYDISGELTFEQNNGVYIVNCDDDVEVKNKNIDKLTDGFEWGEVSGSFYCSDCKNLKSLEGAPKFVGGDFDCSGCKNLKSLEGGPTDVRINFDCSHCDSLMDLMGAPEYVEGDFICSHCKKLSSTEGMPDDVVGSIVSDHCPKLN